MATIPTFDREADRIFGLTVAFDGKRWNVMQGTLLVEEGGAHEDATSKRLSLVETFISKVDQRTVDFFLKEDRIAALRSDIVRNFGPIDKAYGHRPDLLVRQVDVNGIIYSGEAYDDEELALERLRDALRTSLDSVREGSEQMEAAE